MNRRLLAVTFAIALIGCTSAVTLKSTDTAPTGAADPIEAKTSSARRIDGFVPLYWDESNGKMWMEISRFDEEILYQVSLPGGLGSNPVGLDRNQLGGTHVVEFHRVGPNVFLVEPNTRFRAITDDGNEKQAVADSFADSILWGFKVDAAAGNRVLVDATAFFLRDAHGVIPALKRAQQGRFALDPSRSAFYLDRTKGFPKNTEVEVTLTFVSDEPGRLVRGIAPDANAVTVREHHSFVELPEDGYKPRRLDPRIGMFGITFNDYASPISSPVETRWIARHHLVKKDPTAAVSDPVEPIVYYLDPGTPEPIRSALLEGAGWWSQAFEAAGFSNAFRVEMLPEGADPMDARYNMITWVHRSTRGWSYGGGIIDPRTGEIIKGNVSLGSLRVRQDYLIGTGLVPLFDGTIRGPEAAAFAALDPKINPREMALARIRQLGAHEVGHTLGLAHNFAASTYGRASVMDYPAPMIEIKDGKLDLSNAYAKGIGAYDKWVITYAYAQFPPGANENVELEKILEKGIAKHYIYLSDNDARPPGAANPLANLWDNGRDPIAMLRHEMEVRRIALESFGLGNIPDGTPISSLEATLVPLYLHHRYQLEAAVKSIGGLDYNYSVKSGGAPSPAMIQQIVPADRQRDALDAVLETIDPSVLVLPERILKLLPPTAFGYDDGNAELFDKRTDPGFDAIGVATIAADIAIQGLLEPHRAARCVEYHARNPINPGFDEVIEALIDHTWREPRPKNGYQAAVLRAVSSLTLTRVEQLAANDNASDEVRSIASDALRNLSRYLERRAGGVGADAAQARSAREEIRRFLDRPAAPWKPTEALPAPPGSPIGG